MKTTRNGDRPNGKNQETECLSPILYTAGVLCLLVGAGALAVGRWDVEAGFLIGSTASGINFLLMRRGIVRRLGMSPKRAGVSAFSSMAIRYAILAVPLIVAIKVPYVHIAAACVGIFNIQISILIYYLVWRNPALWR